MKKEGNIIDNELVLIGTTNGTGMYEFEICNDSSSGPGMYWKASDNSSYCSLNPKSSGPVSLGGGSNCTVYLMGTTGSSYTATITVEETTLGGNGAKKHFDIEWTKG